MQIITKESSYTCIRAGGTNHIRVHIFDRQNHIVAAGKLLQVEPDCRSVWVFYERYSNGTAVNVQVGNEFLDEREQLLAIGSAQTFRLVSNDDKIK